VINGDNKGFSLSAQGILYRIKSGVEQLVIPKNMQGQVIRQAHGKGHFGLKKTEYIISQEFWFPCMRSKIQKLIDNCIRCILAEKKHGTAEGLLNPIDKGDTPLRDTPLREETHLSYRSSGSPAIDEEKLQSHSSGS